MLLLQDALSAAVTNHRAAADEALEKLQRRDEVHAEEIEDKAALEQQLLQQRQEAAAAAALAQSTHTAAVTSQNIDFQAQGFRCLGVHIVSLKMPWSANHNPE